jgi:uncharacterized membrane-anchored protein YitT (DUF2179 family)
MVYVLTFSVGLLVLEHLDLSVFAYITETGTSKIMGPLVAGIIAGYSYSVLAKASAYSGGTDFISALIHVKNPHKSVYGITFTMNVVIAITSYFVYGYQMEPVIMCILYSFTSSSVTDRMVRNDRSAIRFEIVTKHPEELSRAIIDLLHHSATLIPGKGIYQDKEVSVLICVVNKSQAPLLTGLIQTIPETFAVSSMVSDVIGNFKRVDPHGKQEVSLLDEGEGAGI